MQVLHGHFEPLLVTISFLVATLAGYSALALAGRLTAARSRTSRVAIVWLAGGATAMGVGIWSMHFIGMLAFQLPLRVAYDIPLLLLSCLVAVFASGIALAVASRDRLPLGSFAFAGLAMGVAIAGMHYIGMAGMRVAAALTFNTAIVAASIGIAVAASLGALFLAFRLRHDEGQPATWRRIGAAVVMGIAVSGMHYTGMAAAHFSLRPDAVAAPPTTGSVFATSELAIAVTVGTVLVLGIAILGALLDRMLRAQSTRAAREERLRAEAEVARDAIAFLASASVDLASSLEYETTLARVARLAVPRLADYCLVDILDDAGELRRVAEAHACPDKETTLRRMAIASPAAEYVGHSVYAALKAGETRVVPSSDAGWMKGAIRPSPHIPGAHALRPRSAIVAPLLAQGKLFGIVSFIYADSGRQYTAADMTLAEELTRRAAVALDNARLHRESEAARAEALASNRAKADFLATMSHELRTPLNAIAGYAELLEIGVYGPVTQEQRDGLARIRRSQGHLLGLITQVLSFAKLEVGRVDVQLEDISVNAVLGDLEVLVNAPVQFRHVTYRRIPCPPEVAVLADREKFLQVLLNLLSNAAKFTAAGGSVTILADVSDDVVCVRVRDTGRGIPADKMDIIFEPFVQVDATLTRQTSGVGLGLPISRTLARAMDGDLTVVSVVGEGSTFSVTLPRGNDVPLTRVPPGEASRPRQSVRRRAP